MINSMTDGWIFGSACWDLNKTAPLKESASRNNAMEVPSVIKEREAINRPNGVDNTKRQRIPVFLDIGPVNNNSAYRRASVSTVTSAAISELSHEVDSDTINLGPVTGNDAKGRGKLKQRTSKATGCGDGGKRRRAGTASLSNPSSEPLIIDSEDEDYFTVPKRKRAAARAPAVRARAVRAPAVRAPAERAPAVRAPAARAPAARARAARAPAVRAPAVRAAGGGNVHNSPSASPPNGQYTSDNENVSPGHGANVQHSSLIKALRQRAEEANKSSLQQQMISGCAPIANVRASFGADVADEYSKMLDAVKPTSSVVG